MFGFFKFLFFCVLAIAAGVAAVSVPVAGKSVASHVESFIGDTFGEAPAKQAPARKSAPPAPAKPGARTAARPAAVQPKPRAVENDPTPDEREALERLIGSRVADRPGQGR